MTPAMTQHLTDHVWKICESPTACLDSAPIKPRLIHRWFTVIQGGKNNISKPIEHPQ
jgi:hypothetical protein